MKKLVCPQCKIAAMYVKNAAEERRLVYVTSEGEVVPKRKVNRLKVLIWKKCFAWVVHGMALRNVW